MRQNLDKAFHYEEYEKFLKKISRGTNFYESPMPHDFLIMRHDVEFSVERALKIAQLDEANGITSVFFFQVISGAYNPFSVINRAKINKISDLGHEVGLHFYVTHISPNDMSDLEKQFQIQKNLFETGLGLDCKSFSFHRPPKWVLEIRDDTLFGVKNAYGASYFEFSSCPQDIIYIADSGHKWNYGYPSDNLGKAKLQILIHPDEWCENGSTDEKSHFKSLIEENTSSFIEILDQETKHFAKHRKFFC